MKLYLNRDQSFNDITERFTYQFKEEETLLIYKLRHLDDGVFKVTPSVCVGVAEFVRELQNYKDLVFVCKSKTDLRCSIKQEDYVEAELLYAFNRRWANINTDNTDDIIFDWLNDKGYEKIPDRFKGNDTNEYYTISYSTIQMNINNTKDVTEILVPTNRDARDIGIRKIVNIAGHKGVMVEPGIYYFGKDTRYNGKYIGGSVAQINMNMQFNKKCAIIGFPTDFHLSFNCGVQYLAAGDEECERLKEIFNSLSDEHYFYHEFSIKKEEQQETNEAIDLINTMTKAVEEKSTSVKDKETVISEYQIPNEAEQLVENIGYYDIKVAYKYLIGEQHNATTFDIAYIFGVYLVLLNYNSDTGMLDKKEIDLRTLTDLSISKYIKLQCGVDYPVTYKLLDCKMERIKQLVNENYQQIIYNSEDLKSDKND